MWVVIGGVLLRCLIGEKLRLFWGCGGIWGGGFGWV